MAFGVVLIQWTQFKKNRRIRLWRASLSVTRHQQVFDQLYAEVNGFALSKQARSSGDQMTFTYGEIVFEPFIALLSGCNLNEQSVFYDLGSGTGKAVIACEMVYNVAKCCGIELFSVLNECANNQRQTLMDVPGYYAQAMRIVFIQADIRQSSFFDATHVFINATAFFGEVWQEMSTHLEQVRQGTLVISTSKALNSPLFVTQRITPVCMSWGVVDAFIQQRL